MQQTITVVVPTYKRVSILGRCLKSILKQTYVDYEVIVVNNDQTDGQVELLVNSFHDERFRYALQMRPGVSAARNKGIELAKGDLVLFVDDDDEIEENAIDTIVQYMSNAENQDVCFVWSGIRKLTEQKNSQLEYKESFFHVSDSDLNDMSFLLKIGTGCGLCVRRKDLIEVNGFDESYKVSEDRDLLIRLIHAGKRYKKLDEALYRRYYHDGERLSQKFNALNDAEHDYKLYREHAAFLDGYPALKIKLLELLAKHYSLAGERFVAIKAQVEAIKLKPWRLKGLRRLFKYTISLFLFRKYRA